MDGSVKCTYATHVNVKVLVVVGSVVHYVEVAHFIHSVGSRDGVQTEHTYFNCTIITYTGSTRTQYVHRRY